MTTISSGDYLRQMLPFLEALPEFLRDSSFGGRYYGTGESAHWPVQSNCNIFAALAVLGVDPTLPEARRAECRDLALQLLRYALATHLTGSERAADGNRWGHHWISVLGLERMCHGVNALRDYLTDQDKEDLRRLTLSEADWLLEEYPVVAGMIENNKPESNIWNGGYLFRAAFDYPDAPNAARYREKGTRFLVNGISHPLDAASEVKFGGKTVRELHTGFNFTPNYSLDHHRYLNVGYMVICLSNLAMLHFNFKERGQAAPPELYWHARDLWKLVKEFTFPDGRLLRLGGDTRTRYTYCQCYAIPVWLFAADVFGDAEVAAFESAWLKQVETDRLAAADGTYFGGRLANMKTSSYYYYTRLESDAFLTLSYGAYWRRKFELPQPPAKVSRAPFHWQDEYHGATFLRDEKNVRSWVWHAGQGVTGLCLPLDRSDLAEWQHNLAGELRTPLAGVPENEAHEHCEFPGGFLNFGSCLWREQAPIGENEGNYLYARQQCAAAALPDGKTLLVLDYARVTKEITLSLVTSLNLKVPNDFFNGSKRRYQTEKEEFTLSGRPGVNDNRKLDSDTVTVDGELSVRLLYGGDGLTLRRPAEPDIVVKRYTGPRMHSLYVDEICTALSESPRRWKSGEIAIDCGAAVSAGKSVGSGRILALSGEQRAVEFTTPEGKTYLLAVDFSDTPALPSLPGRILAVVGRNAELREL